MRGRLQGCWYGSEANDCRIIEHINRHEGVQWVTMEQMADDFKANNLVPQGAKMPAPPGEILKLQKEGKAYSLVDYNGPMVT